MSGPDGTVEDLRTLVDLLRQRAAQRGDKLAFTFSRDGDEHEISQVSYRELDLRARRIATDLQGQGAAGERVLVLCPPGLDFIASFFGCLYAGAIAIPVHPPMREHLLPRVESIIADVQPGFALTTSEIEPKIKPAIDTLPGGRALRWTITDVNVAGSEAAWVAPQIDGESIAMLQYTSGSTSAPKGVVLTHGNLVHNLKTIAEAWGAHTDMQATGVFWLPPYHDMGLIGGLLETLYVAGNSILMPPTAFIKRPMRWLEAISRHRAMITAAPNFAFDLCVELSTPQERAALDLSNWTVALCGAEPVRTATLDSFAELFAPAGFRPESFYPVYGLAEGTLLVSGGSDLPVPMVQHIDRVALGDNRVIDVAADHPNVATMVGCGKPRGGQRVIIVDPEARLECATDRVGEIWVAGGSVAHGYWGAPELSAETFAATLADSGDGPFLRTGDLGFLHSGELFVTGRRKDLIIIRGTNHYPNDIELTVQNTNPALLRGRGAVFSIAPEPGAAEQLVVVQEVDPSRVSGEQAEEAMQVIRTAVTENHSVRTHAVVLVQPLQLPTTSSGKIQRSACKQQYLDGELPVVAQWPSAAATAQPQPEPEPAPVAAPAGSGTRSAAEISSWLIDRLSQDLELPVAEIDPAKPFAFYGLDSIHAVRLSSALEKWLGAELAPTIAYEYPSIDILSAHLARVAAKAPGATSEQEAERVERPAADEPIAIVGIGCRFPGADGPEAFWRLLSGEVDATSDVPADRWDVDAFYNPDPAVPGTAVTRRGGFLGQVDQFDFQFFGISPRESAQMDPQQRLLLEVAWEALEDAGQVPDDLAGTRTGVFVGISTNDYGFLRLGQPQLVDAYTGTGNALSIAANRLSYTFDFHGPSLSVDTACSSSLVAVDLACRSLRDGECNMALAAGVNVILSPALAINFSKARVMAPDGRCKTFDADADGYVRGEGAGVVVLKPLSRALEDNDPIYAVIRGSATNSDGRTNGLIAPSGRAQEGVVTEAFRRAGLPAGAVQYVEAHGTGTAIGDAIEANALGTVLAEGRPEGSRCLVGSVKTNIGHLEAAAGIAGLIKVALSLQHRAIPASLNYTEPNPHILFDNLPLEVVRTLTPWPAASRAVAGVSSFGFGGTNAHVVLTEAPQVRTRYPDDTAEPRAELLALSARSPEALTALVGEYEMALFSGGLLDGGSLTDLCFTAGARRGHHDYRLSVVGDSPAALFESLSAYRLGESRPGLSVGHCTPSRPGPGVTFVFSGQGSQWHGMALRLQAEEPVFAEALAACDNALHPHLGHSILKELAAQEGPEDRSKLSDIGILQPTIFAIQVALAALWRSWGVEPAAVVGHSLGEAAAAHVAGALSLEDAARVICARARMLRGVRGRGAMMVTETTMAEAQELIAGHEQQVAIAASNSYRSTVLAGERVVLEQLMARLQQRDRFCRWIDVDVASHSPQMEALGAGLRGSLVKLKPTAPTVPMYSTVTGELVGDKLLDADYWVANLCSPVRFSPALRRLLETGHNTFIELSPHPILLTGAREDAEHLHRSATLLPSMRRDDGVSSGRSTMLGSLGTLYTLGHRVAWEQIYPEGSRCVPAPTYPWQRVHSWLNAGSIAAPRHSSAGAPGGGWRGPIRSAAAPETVLAEIDVATLSAEQLRELALTAAEVAFGPGSRSVGELSLRGDLDRARTVQFALAGDTFECYGGAGEDWSLLATGTIAAGDAPPVAPPAADPRDGAYEMRWQPASLPVDGESRPDGRPAEPGSWLILSDGPVADTLRDHLEAQSQSCVLVEPVVGLAEIERVSADSYRIDPARAEHFAELLRAAFGGDRPPCRGVVHLWNLLAAPAADTTEDSLATATDVGTLSVVHLIQALTLAGWSESPRLWLVTRGAQPAGREEGAVSGALSVSQAPVWGLGRSIDHEHPELHATGVDLSADGGSEELRGLFSEVWSDNRETDVALRGHRRYVARLEPYSAPSEQAGELALRDDATYLVTGGLGAVGGKVAGWLVERGARHLVLMGRGAPSATAEASLDALRAAGAEVTVARGDVTKSDDVAAVLATIGASMPPLRGVVHAAGTVDDAILARLDAPKLRGVMAPKVQGAWNLHTLTADAQLDLFVMFSSAASVLGSPGAANYGAANAFLDALAWHRRAAGLPALSVNFGPWAGLGMFTNSELHRHFSHYGVEGMSAERYFAALSALLADGATEAVVLDIDWARWRPSAQSPLLSDLQATVTGDGSPGSGLFEAVQAADPQERQQLLETYLRDLVAGKLGLPPAGLDVAAPLNSLGVDSLITLELRIQVERELGIVVPVARLLDGPSVVSLSSWLSEQLAAAGPGPADDSSVPEAVAPQEIDVLTQVSELSDDAVDALLAQMMAQDEQVKDGGSA
ncbi:type I polyketide synthase [Mycolicibacter longobardus]|uniref:Beta-ketoacyl synthase n=1 Tax=Mycolicibacter longobardus TaxID=1108812 RepID=A0A1X1YIW3_9MYCO|nr:type I polyketide synthase [Mycolicibacter longobardus]MCV7384950.1 type I polyketide synthase [Mycolicibacter longobardus]ORW10951.1 beta-ketoacyl synthase [Mycolicibacter longobardus]